MNIMRRKKKKMIAFNFLDQKAKSLALRAPIRLPDAQVQDVNHSDLAVLQTGGQDRVIAFNF